MADNKKSSISKRSSCYLLNLKQPDKTAKRLKLSFQRTSARVIVLKTDRDVEATVGFLDISETGAGIYTPELLNKGSMVELCVTEPAILNVRGVVAWSVPVKSGIHQGKFNCRSGVHFVFEGEAQKTALLEFIKKAGQDPVESMKASLALQAAGIPPIQAGNNTQDPPHPMPGIPSEAAAVPAVPVAAPVDAGAAPATPPAAEAAPPAAPAAEAAPAATTPTEGGDSGQKAA